MRPFNAVGPGQTAPLATEGGQLVVAAAAAPLMPGSMSPAVGFLASEDAATRAILRAGDGNFERNYVTSTGGAHMAAARSSGRQVTH